MHQPISKRVLALILAVFLLSSIPISTFVAITTATADEATPDEAKQTVEQPAEQKKQRKVDKSPSGNSSSGIYISRTSENGEQYNKVGITVTQSEDCTYDESSDTYNYLTGKPAQINISISNQNNADEYKFARVYFKFDNIKGNIGQDVGTFKLHTEYSSYDVDLTETEQDGLYYYDFSPVNIGDALSYTAEPLFPNLTSGGGSLEIWGELAKSKEDFSNNDVLSTPDKLNCQWLTTLNEPSYYSNSAISAEFTGNGSSDKKIYAPEIYCDTKLDFPYSANASGVNFAKDYQFSIVIEPSDDLQFKPDIINGIKNDNWSVGGIIDGKDGKRVLLDLSGQQWELCRFEVNESYSFRDFNISSVDVPDEETVSKIRVNGVITNPEFHSWGVYAEKEIAVNFKFKLAKHSIYTDLTADNAEVTTPETTASKVTFRNTGTLHYEFGGTKKFSSDRETKLYVSAAEAKLTHINDGDPYTGDTFTASAVIENSGTLPLTSAKTLSMQCGKEYYIEPENIQKMFNEDTEKILSIRINAIDFYEVEEKTVTDINGDTVKTDYRNNDKNATYEYVADYTVTAEPKVRNMQCVINWDDSKEYLRATFSKEGVVPATYYIGENQEFKTVQELFKHLGALKNTDSSDYTYYCTWNLQKTGYKLYSGDRDIYKMYVTVNDSFFNINKDTAKSSTYSALSEYISSTLSMTDKSIISKWGEPVCWQDSLTNPQMTITASDGQTISDGTEFKEYTPLAKDTVIEINKRYSFWHSSYDNSTDRFTSYKNIPVKTLIGKPFSLYVPVKDNNQLADTGLETREYNGQTYYVLNKVGTYHNLKFAEKVVDTVTVDKDKTFIEMYITPPNDDLNYYEVPTNFYAASESDTEFVPVYFWCGNINGHRYVDYVPLTLYHNGSLDLKIVSSLGVPEDYSDDKVISKKALTEAEDITYRLEFTPYYEQTFTGEILRVDDVQNGSSFNLKLPQPPDGFAWSEDNISVWYSENTDSNITDFSISNREYYISDNTIYWKPDFNIYLNEKVGKIGRGYIYIKVSYPPEKWSDFQNKYLKNPAVLEARYADGVNSYNGSKVTHSFCVQTQARLQVGVLSTYKDFTENTDYNSTLFYNASEGDSYRSVKYYVYLYNDGTAKGNLYLNNGFYYSLPDGFEISSVAYNHYDGHDVQDVATRAWWYLKYIRPDNGQQDGYGTRYGTLKYSSRTGQGHITVDTTDSWSVLKDDIGTYIEPGCGMAFVITCKVNEGTKADEADFKIGLPYYDYCDTPVVLAADSLNLKMGRAENYGDCEILNKSQTAKYGLSTDGFADDQEWLVSDVVLSKGKVIPNLTARATGLYKGSEYIADPASGMHNDSIEWTAECTNTGDFGLNGYTFTSISQAPYSFQGLVKLNGADLFEIRRSDEPEFFDGIYVVIKKGERTHYFSVDKNSVITISEPSYLPNVLNSGIEIGFFVNETGDEVLSVSMTDKPKIEEYGGKMKFSVCTKNLSAEYKNTSYINTMQIQPNNDIFNPKDVLFGNPIGDNTVEAVAMLPVAYGEVVSSNLQIYQKDDDGNRANSTDSKNYIVLPNKADRVIYSLNLSNNTSSNVDKLVLIDNLPQKDDKLTFGDGERHSKFTVNLASDIKVLVNDTELSADKFSVDYTDRTSFINQDWKGTSSWDDTPTSETRSFRVIIDDNSIIAKNSTVKVQFEADIPSGQEIAQGDTAWNSFGYHYTLSSRELESSSAVIGLRSPTTPTIQKVLKTVTDKECAAKEDMQFTYIIYEGEEIDCGSDITEYSLYLAMNSNGRRYTYLTVDIPQGQAQSEAVQLKDLHYYDYRGEYVPLSRYFVWNKGQKYTIVELPDSYEEYDFDSIGGKKARSYTFEYSNEKATDILSISRSKEQVQENTDLPSTGGSGENILLYISGFSTVLTLLILRKGKFSRHFRL